MHVVAAEPLMLPRMLLYPKNLLPNMDCPPAYRSPQVLWVADPSPNFLGELEISNDSPNTYRHFRVKSFRT